MTTESVLLFDVNALVALALTTHQHHHPAHAFLAGVTGAWATCPTTEAALYRLLLNPLVTGAQRSASEVTHVVQGMHTDPRWRFLVESTSLADAVVDLGVLMGHQQVTDLHLVNVAAVHGARLATFDRALMSWVAPADRRRIVVIPA